MKLNTKHEELDFTPVGIKIEKELNFAQAFAIAAGLVLFFLVIGNLVLGLN